jgi:ketosteroid isomerase-like protein
VSCRHAHVHPVPASRPVVSVLVRVRTEGFLQGLTLTRRGSVSAGHPPVYANALATWILGQQLTEPRPLEAAMTDVDDFLAEIHPRLVAELQALHNGDPGPRLAMWSTQDPVTLFGAAMSGSGWEQVSQIFRSIASRWSDCTDQRVEILAAGVSGDLAYTVELEHTSVSVDGVPVEPYTLRVTQVYRREDGEWKVVHRHGDQVSIDQRQSLPGEASTA